MTCKHDVYTKEKNDAEKFSVPQNTLTYWIKHKEEIISKYESDWFWAKRQKLRVGKHDSIDKAVYKWFLNARERNVPDDGQIIREKALDFPKEHNRFQGFSKMARSMEKQI